MMRLKQGYVRLERLCLHARHGVLPQEQVVGNDYEVSLRLGYPLETAMESDDVKDTINYAEVCSLVKREMEQPSRLLERVAARVGESLFAAFPLLTMVDITLTKKNPPMGADCDGATVELHLINDKTGDLPFGFSQ